MKRKFSIFNFQFSIILGILFFVFTYYILHTTYYIPNVSAQTACQQEDSSVARAEGLVSSVRFGSLTRFGNPGKICVINDKASISVPKITDSFGNFKATFYTQSKSTSKKTADTFPNPQTLTGNGIYAIQTGDLNISGLTYSGVNIVFADNAININSNILNNNPAQGLVLISNGDINIASNVTEIDAYLVSFGSIRTAGGGCDTNSVPLLNTQKLTVKGGLVSLNASNTIKFCRALEDTTEPAETIVHEPKYPVILQDFLSQMVNISTEETNYSYNL